MTAIISECGAYRYFLQRQALALKPERGTALFCMLNPSTADATADDPTIRRCRGFAESWRCNGFAVVNLYALRSTDPKALNTHADPVGPENDDWLRRVAREYGDVVCAWGANANPGREIEAAEIFRRAGARLFCFGTTKDGAPRHPLYIPKLQPLVEWLPRRPRHAGADSEGDRHDERDVAHAR